MRYLMPLLLVILLASCGDPAPPPPFVSGKEGEKILNITYQLPDSTSYAVVDTALGKAAVMFYFTTECPYCRAEVRSLTAHADSLKNIQFYLLTNATVAELKDYQQEFKLDKYPNIAIGIDTGMVMLKYFGITGVPYIAVYDKQHKLKKAYNSITPTREIRKVAEE